MLRHIFDYLPPIHKEGYLFIGIFLVISLICLSFSKSIGMVAFMLTIWCICFFRDPERVTPPIESVIVSPADGIVESISKAQLPRELGEDNSESYTRVSIFLSVFDVHVNRIPIAGLIKKLYYHPGKFISATLDKSSELNERQSILIETYNNQKIAVVQIAGLLARRIVCDLDENEIVKAGQRFGIIRFGSRVDIYFPSKINPQVYIGQYMIGGETIIGKLDNE